jgi:ABC-2 type transport system ATP-binding protein
MTVNEYLKFAAELKGVKKSEIPEQLNKVRNLTKLTEMQERLIKHLSKGYKQRVGLAQALLGSPKVLILDEPTVGLDPQQIIEIRSLIKDLGAKCTVILSSHILSEVEAVCDRVLVIDHGKLIADDSPENLSKNLSGDASVHVRVLGDREGAEKVLNGLEGVKEVVFNGLKEESALEFRVTPESRSDLRPSIAKALVEAGYGVIGLRFAEMTLEEIFLDLIAKEEA